MYSWTGSTYDKAGSLTVQKQGKALVQINATTEDVYTKYNTYTNGLKTQESDSEGRKTVYTYDGDGNIASSVQAVTASESKTTEYKYNYLKKPVSVTNKVRNGDIYGNGFGDAGETTAVSTYSYDLNGNLTAETDAAGTITSYTYDKLNRNLSAKKQLKDASGSMISNVTTSKTYTWDGQAATETDANGNKTSYTYDAQGNQTKITDALGNVTLKYYDRAGNNTAVVSPKNYVKDAALSNMEHTEFTYDDLGRVLTQTEVYKKMTLDSSFAWTGSPVSIAVKTYQYDTLGNVISSMDALGNTTLSEYNLAGLLETTTDPESKNSGLPYTVKYTYNGLKQKVKEEYNGEVCEYSYDGAGNQLKTVINNVTKAMSSYDLLSQAVSITDGRGNTTAQTWNAFGKLSETVAPGDSSISSNTTVYQYDILGNLMYTKGSTGTVTTFTYDSFGRNLSKTVSGGNKKVTTSQTYDNSGNILTQTDGNGNTTASTYNALNKLLTSTNAMGQTTAYTYDADGNLTAQKDYLGNTTTKVYDGINRLIEVRNAYGTAVQQLLYNDADAQTDSYDALHNHIQYLYDRNLRRTGTVDGEGNLSKSTYDSRGNVSTKTDGNGNSTVYQYDGENCLTCVTDALGNTTSYTYDAAGNRISKTDGNGNITTYRYNCRNLLTAKTDPAGSTESYTYDADQHKTAKTDRSGVTTAYTYDLLGSLTSEDAGGEVQSYTYDNNGNLLTMTDATGTTTRTYDALNRNTSKTVPDIGTSTYEYDLAAEAKGEHSERTTDPKGNVTLDTYDRAGRLSTVTAGGKTTAYQYDNNGNRSAILYPDGTSENYTYNVDNQVIYLINKKADGTTISWYNYTYDEAGNQLTKVEAKGTTTYTYDRLNRLSSVTEPSGKATGYTYDGAGNRKTETVQKDQSGSTTVYSYDSRNRLVSTESTGGAYIKYVYDNNGNTVSKITGTKKAAATENLTADDLPDFGLTIKHGTDNGTGTENVTLYTYDHYNRLTEAKTGDKTADYAYNAQGYRVQKTVNGSTTKYLYNTDKVVLETDAAGNQTAIQVYGSALLCRTSGAQSYYYLYNAHGDVTGLIDAGGTIAATYDYDAFGNVISKTGNVDNHVTYSGYQEDDETGLYYLNARYYDSEIARFITEDSYTGEETDPLSLNLYTYCSNNPIMYTDPSGHKIKGIIQLGFLLKGFVEEGTKITLSNMEISSIKDTVKKVESTEKLIKDITSGDINLKDLKKIGVNVVSGDLNYVVKHSYIITNKKKYSNKVIENYGKHLAGAYEEIVTAGFTVAGLIEAAKSVGCLAKGVAGSAEDVSGAGKAASEVAKGASKSVGELKGSLDSLTKAERTMVDDLLNQGKDVEIIPRSTVQGVKTPDFYVDGIKTELKTLNGTSLNTPVTRIQDGFKQGASTVIIDGRVSNLSVEQANTVISRINGIYKNNIPGKIEIWTNSGIVYGGK